MDSDQTNQIEIDFSDVCQDLTVDGHGDVFVVNSDWLDTINISAGSMDQNYGAVPPVSVLTWPNTSPTYSFDDLTTSTAMPSGRIHLTGADADIEINGESVVSMLREIRDRLNILQVSKEMEREWAELRILREQYEAKLTECTEKSRAWAALTQPG
jgi:hypothetical protein